MSGFWNERFAGEEYVYGEVPNVFYKQELEKLPAGKILFPAEGEGRNAVFAATLGWEVSAFDLSEQARQKAMKLANKTGVEINYSINGYDDVFFEKGSFDCVALVFAHLHPEQREEYHKKMASFLKAGGVLLLEGFSKEQILNDTGGPKNVQMLFSEVELRNDFSDFSELQVTTVETILDEGIFHRGKASVIRAIGKK